MAQKCPVTGKSTITIIHLPGPDKYGRNGWCFSTEHGIDIEGSVPVSYSIGSRYFDVYDVIAAQEDVSGPLCFNPIPQYEPLYSTLFVDDMQEWSFCVQQDNWL